MAKSTVNAKKAPVQATFERGDKLKRAVEIVNEAFQNRLAMINAGQSVEGMDSPRSLAIAKIAKELFPAEGQKAACNTYFSLAYSTLLTQGNEAALAAAGKGKAVYSVYNLHRAKMSRDKTKVLEGTVSAFGLVTSQSAAKELTKLLMADGFCKGQVTKDSKPLAA